MGPPKLSVLMAVRNGEHYLRSSLGSILGQTFSDFELLVINDGSTDGTRALLTEYAQYDARMIVRDNEVNMGLTRTSNKLFRMAQGIYVTRHDADDLSLPERFQRQIEFLDSHPEIGLVASQVQAIDGAGIHLQAEWFSGPGDNERIQRQLMIHNCLCQGSVMFRRVLLETMGLYDEMLTYSQDYDLWLRMAEVTQLAKLSERLYQYRVHTGSVTQQNYKRQTIFTATALDRAVQRRIGLDSSRVYSRATATAYLRAAIVNALASDWVAARWVLGRCLALDIGLFDSYEPLELLLAELTHKQPPDFRLSFYQLIFNKLFSEYPKVAAYALRLISRLHLSEVFRGAQAGNWKIVNQHLWIGLWQDPAWLFNKGVFVIMLKSILWRIRGLTGFNQRSQA